MASQHQNIDGSSIEHSQVQQNQAGRDVVSFQNSHDNQVIINNTFLRLFGKSKSSGVDWDWAMKLLKQKQLPEIRKRLTDTLGRDSLSERLRQRILMDVSIEERQNWVNRSPLAADRTLQINGEDCGTLDANKMLIETFGRDDIEGKLLILGAPGAGKTTALLSLAEQLVYGAISQPKTVIPVIFELSTWQNDNQSIQSWLIEQLYDIHGGNRKSKLYEQWLERQVLLPLLDGLDELGLERQKKCTEKLNEFAEHYPQLVVCCRVKEFEAVDIKLRNLRGAVCLQSLSDSQIQHYLDTLQRPELWEAIQTTPSLQAMLEPNIDGDPGLLRVPLFVKLVADVYDPQQPISSKADLLDKYIDRQLSFDKREIDRRKELNEYKWAYKIVKLEPDWKKTRNNLNWIARNLQANNKVEFLIEHLQPSSIESKHLQYRYRLFFWLIFWLILCLVYTLIFGLINYGLTVDLLFAIIGGLLLSLISELISAITYRFIYDSKNRVIYGLFGGSIGALFFCLSLRTNLVISAGVLYGLIFGIIGDLIVVETIESFQISVSKIVSVLRQKVSSNFKVGLIYGLYSGLAFGLIGGIIYGIIRGKVLASRLIAGLISGLMGGLYFGIVFGLIGGLIYGIIGGMTFGLIGGLKQELKLRLRPNQGIGNSFQSQMWTSALFFLPIILLSAIFNSLQYWFLPVFIAFIFGFAVGGGKACLQHLSLRIVLLQSGLPWNFARFLNYCVERRLLLRVGGSYRFLHRELLDHFAQSNH